MVVNIAQTLKVDGIVLISLALRSDANNIQLEKIASSKSHVVLTSYPSDNSKLSGMMSMICAGKTLILV